MFDFFDKKMMLVLYVQIACHMSGALLWHRSTSAFTKRGRVLLLTESGVVRGGAIST